MPLPLFLVALIGAVLGRGFAAERPNFLILLADDLGYGDVACYGHPTIQTPNLDRLAREGLRLTSCYAGAANCSPSRAALLTGRTPYRAGIYSAIPMLSPMHLRTNEVTVAALLRGAGYATALVGKWHLNGMFNLPGQPQPADHGFDHWFATQNNALPNHRNPYNFVRNGIPVGPVEGYASQIVADEAIRWLREGRQRRKPFFLYVAFHEPHEPIATAPRFADLYAAHPEPGRRAHDGNITQMDDAVGRLLRALDELGLRENTLVFFSSDNGPAVTRQHPHGSAGPLRDKKGSLHEGGIRVPGILRWPGRTKPGTVSDEPVGFADLLPTICAITGVPAPADRALDGASFLPILEGKPVVRRTPLYWQFTWANAGPQVALRQGDWKIVAHLEGLPKDPRRGNILETHMRALKTAEPGRMELYNLRADIGETTDLAAREPARFNELSALLRAKYREVRDEAPVWPAWDDPAYEQQRIEWPDYVAPARPAARKK